mgnify:FL=1
MEPILKETALAGRVALVTGATRGIGAACAAALASAGAYVYGTATTEEGAAKISAALGDKGRGIVLNVTDRKACADTVATIVGEKGAVDILVNNAGITRDMLAMRLSDEAWDAVIATNLTAAFVMTRAVLRPMMKARFGRIINMSSVVGSMGNAGQANYAAAKAGLIGMSKSVAQEVASRGITVNCIAPGFIDTDMTRALAESDRETLAERIPARRLGQTDDIAGAVLYLASDLAAYVTGAVLPVNGGLFMG